LQVFLIIFARLPITLCLPMSFSRLERERKAYFLFAFRSLIRNFAPDDKGMYHGTINSDGDVLIVL